MTGLEPAADCPIHGGGDWPPRCETCGKFLPWNPQVQMTFEVKEPSQMIIFTTFTTE